MSAGAKVVARFAHETVRVDLGARSYEITIGPGLIEEAGTRIAALRPGAAAFVVTDTNVAKVHLSSLERSLGAAGIRTASFTVPPGEGSKDFATLQRILDAILAAKIERNDLVIALGGGVVGDLAGFAAAVALRGIDVVQIPTTLLAQVDSSIGGKTGINTVQGKNLVGAFHQPCLVLADTGTLDTLPPRQFRSGYAEVAKVRAPGRCDLLRRLERNWGDVFAGRHARIQAIATSCRMKAEIVGRDERESGERALLNLGHTFGHALETATGFSDRLLARRGYRHRHGAGVPPLGAAQILRSQGRGSGRRAPGRGRPAYAVEGRARRSFRIRKACLRSWRRTRRCAAARSCSCWRAASARLSSRRT